MSIEDILSKSHYGANFKASPLAVEAFVVQSSTELNNTIANQKQLQEKHSFLSKALLDRFLNDDAAQDALDSWRQSLTELADDVGNVSIYRLEAKRKEVDFCLSYYTKQTETHENMRQAVTGMAKSACLFLPEFTNAKTFLGRRFGLLATAGIYALDEWKPAAKFEDQVADLTLGALKGVGLKATFGTLAKFQPKVHYIPAQWLRRSERITAATQGVLLGEASRAVDTALSRATYLDDQGKASLEATSNNFREQVFNPTHIASDLFAFHMGSTLQKSLGMHISTHVSAATFGFANGVTREMDSEIRKALTEPADPNPKLLGFDERPEIKILTAGCRQAVLDSIAAIPGAYLHRQQVRKHFEPLHINTPQFVDKKSLEGRFQKRSENEKTFDAWTIDGEHLSANSNVNIYDVQGHSFNVVEPKRVWKNVDGKIVLEEADCSSTAFDRSEYIGKNKYSLVRYLDELPRSDIIKEIELRPDEHHFYWKKKPAKAAASMSTENTMRFYEQPSGGIERAIVFHEWAHGLHNYRPQDLNTFEHAAKLEEKGFYASEYASTNHKENWAVHMGEIFLKPDVNSFLRLARYAPLRTVVMARSIEAAMLEVPESQRGLYGSQFLKRAQLIRRELEPLAIYQLKNGEGNPSLRQSLLDDLTKPITATEVAAKTGT